MNLQIWDRDIALNDFIGDASFAFSELANEAFEKQSRVKKQSQEGSLIDWITKKDADKI